MLRHILRRTLQALLVLLLVAVLVFLLFRVIPGDPIATMMGEHVNPAAIERMTSELGLDQPVTVQFFRYLAGALRGDFGTSYSLGKPVTQLIGAAFPNTLILSLAAALFAWSVGLVCGIIAAVNHNGDSDSTGAVTGNILGALLGYAAIDEKWKKNLELADVILEMADDLYLAARAQGKEPFHTRAWKKKYVEMRRYEK